MSRIEELMGQTAYPHSRSVYGAMMQLKNEMWQEFNSRTCGNCSNWDCEIHCTFLDMPTDEDFGCNVFERIKNEN